MVKRYDNMTVILLVKRYDNISDMSIYVTLKKNSFESTFNWICMCGFSFIRFCLQTFFFFFFK